MSNETVVISTDLKSICFSWFFIILAILAFQFDSTTFQIVSGTVFSLIAITCVNYAYKLSNKKVIAEINSLFESLLRYVMYSILVVLFFNHEYYFFSMMILSGTLASIFIFLKAL